MPGSPGLVINVTFDSSVNSAPTGFVTAVNSAVSYLESIITNPVTLNIHVGYGEADGQTLGSNDLGESFTNYVTESYNTVRSALLAHGAPGASTLPSVSPFRGTAALFQAEAKALGVISANSTTPDGYVGFGNASGLFDYVANTTPASNQYDFRGVFLHEITEVMGRISLLQPSLFSAMDLYRYTSPGARDLTQGGNGSTAYFSINNGATNLGTWNNNASVGDLGDWKPPGPAPGGNDSFNYYGGLGVIGQLSANDLTLMQALGWTTQSSTPAPTTPTVSAILETPATGDLNAGKTVTIKLSLSSAVTVTGAPTLVLNDGGVATYASGSGTNALTFSYTVGAHDANVSALAVSSVALNGGTIKDTGGNAATLALTGISQAGPQIDTVVPVVSALAETPATGDLGVGKTVAIRLSLSEAVTVTGAPTLVLNDGAVATYASGSGTNALTFNYTVGAHDTNVAALVVSSVALNGATLKDSAGNAANLALTGIGQAGPQIDATIPAIISLVETPATGSLGAGGTVSITLNLSEAVTVSGAPKLVLNDGGSAVYAGGSGTSALTFSYTVGAHDSNVSALAVSSVALSGGTIQDGAGNAATLALGGIIQAGPQIATTAPAVTSLTETPRTGDLGVGKTVAITVNLSGAVTVSGAPTLTLNDGGAAVYTSGSGSSALTFTYVVGAHDSSVASLAVSSVVLNGGAIKDGAGNAATLSLGGISQAGPQIDTVAATITSLAETPRNGNLGLGKTVAITVNLSEAVTVSGAPSLALNDGGSAVYMSGSGSKALVFSYTVGAHDSNVASLAVSSVALNGATILDPAGNAANLGLSGINQAGPQISTTMTAAQAISAGAAAGPFAVVDSGANVLNNLAGLQNLAVAHELSPMVLTDLSPATLAITAAHLVSYSTALGDIGSAFSLSVTSAFTVPQERAVPIALLGHITLYVNDPLVLLH